MSALSILYQDNHLLVIDKPAGIATMGAESQPTVHSLAADYLKSAYHKPGRAFVGVVSRLDSMTTGALVLAKTSKAASRLTPQFADKTGGGALKIYLAVISGELDSDQGELIDHLRKDDRAHRMRVVGATMAGAAQARLRYLTLAHRDEQTIVAVQLLSGRKHQIRVQFSDRGQPVIGDRKYGSMQPFSAGIALHSWRLEITHPTTKQRLGFVADLPKSWQAWARVLPQPDKIWARVSDGFGLTGLAISENELL